MKRHLRDLLTLAIEKTAKGGDLRMTDLPPLLLETPKQKDFGDLATNVALVWAQKLKKPPRAIAEAILKNLEDPEGILADTAIAGPGFLNFTFSPKFYYRRLGELESGRGTPWDLGRGAKALVEFASVNPTGPLHVGHGRVAVIGDVLARLLKAAGFKVEREYYVNDTGKQMENLGLSLYLRHRELRGENIKFPEEGYHGEYVKELAAELKNQGAEKLLPEEKKAAIDFLSHYGGEHLLTKIRDDLEEFGIGFDSFFSELDMRNRGEVTQTIERLRAQGALYEGDGALWFRSSEYGDDKDRTVVKTNGELTYFASDIAYHRNKFERGFNRLINVWGADHHGYAPRLRAALKALGYDPRLLDIVLVQMVNLTRAGEPVRMGKRFGEFVTLREVVEEVGKDAARFFFLMRKADTHLDFDLELAKRQSSENPVFYVQYAHARIASILEQARQAGIPADDSVLRSVEVERLAALEELEQIKQVIQFHDVVEDSVQELEPHRIVFYLVELAGMFHRYYNRYRVITDDVDLTQARLLLARHVQRIVREGLDLLGVEAPLRMARADS